MASTSATALSSSSIRVTISGLSNPANAYVQFQVNNNTLGTVHTWTDSSTSTSTSITLTGLSPNTTYSFSTFANYEGTNYSTGSASATTLSPPAPSTPSPPLGSRTGEGEIYVQWNSVPDATSYQLRVRNYAGSSYYTTSSTSRYVGGLEYGVSYFLSVQAINNYGSSSYSSESTLTTAPKTPFINQNKNEAGYIEVYASGMSGNYTGFKFILYDQWGGYLNSSTQTSSVCGFNVNAGTTYILGVQSYFDISGTTIWSYNESRITITNAKPAQFSWSTNVSSRSTFNLLASDWNKFTSRINEWRKMKSLTSVNFTTAISGGKFDAFMFNEANNAINAMISTGISNKSRNDPVNANDLNTLVNKMNSIT